MFECLGRIRTVKSCGGGSDERAIDCRRATERRDWVTVQREEEVQGGEGSGRRGLHEESCTEVEAAEGGVLCGEGEGSQVRRRRREGDSGRRTEALAQPRSAMLQNSLPGSRRYHSLWRNRQY